MVGKQKRKRSLGRLWRGWKDNTGMDLKGIGREGLDWIHMAQERNQRWAVCEQGYETSG